MNNILPVYKPSGITSYDVIRQFKKQTDWHDKVGHGGSLDPFAEGVLLLLLGKATKKFEEIQKWQKVYRGRAVMGAKSTTLDREGQIQEQKNSPTPKLREIEFAARNLIGQREQEVPKYSAAKYKGIPLYKLVREGKKVPQKKKWVNIYHIRVIRYEFPELEFETDVSSGTYIRQLSYDWLKSVGLESYLDKLIRLEIGKIKITDTCQISDFANNRWQEFLVKNTT